MSDIAIRVENLSKRYRIGGKQQRYRRFTETVMDTLSAPARRLRNSRKPTPPEETLWALKDISFQIRRGEVVGIIGRNGAGKSTLLKILSRITEPTTGRVEVHGRVGSLLEVGTGFHPELTGRENIYLNGAILGMRRAEIERKLDDIVAFAEIGRFLDTPAKHYSSGMYVRLAFAVAAHLEPEILLVDEVLAVGDGAFQEKCLGKMGDVAREGRTVLLVSHNLSSVDTLCQRCLLLADGRIVSAGESREVISEYMRRARLRVVEVGGAGLAKHRRGTGQAEIVEVRVTACTGQPWSIPLKTPFKVELKCRVHQRLADAVVGFAIMSMTGDAIVTFWNTDGQARNEGLWADGTWTCQVLHNPLKPGSYSLRAAIFKPRVGDFLQHDWIDQVASFEVLPSEGQADQLWRLSRSGHVLGLGEWSFEPEEAGMLGCEHRSLGDA